MPATEQTQWELAAAGAPGRWRRFRKAVEGKGPAYVARLALRWAVLPLWRLSSWALRRGLTFQSRRYPYFVHGYNSTWCNERAVEIPIVWAEVCARHPGRVLEVGNVLSHY